MLPVVSEETRQELMSLVTDGDLKAWQREMIHHLKEDNPEVNTMLLELAQLSDDPKKIVLAGYLVYKALEQALDEEEPLLIS